MLSLSTHNSPVQDTLVAVPAGRSVELADGRLVAIDTLDLSELVALQAEQEPLFARVIAASPRDSQERAEIIRTAYASICSILDEQGQRGQTQGVFSMGMDPRYADLVLRVLQEQERRGIRVYQHGLTRGALLRPLGNVVYLMPPFCVDQGEILKLAEVISEGIDIATR